MCRMERRKVDRRYPHLSCSFFPLFSPPPEKTSELSKRNCRCGKRRCAGRCFPNGEAKRSSLFRGVVRGNEKSFDRAIKSRWHLLPRVLPSPCSGPFVKQMQTRSWDSLPPKVAARTSLSQSATRKNRKDIYGLRSSTNRADNDKKNFSSFVPLRPLTTGEGGRRSHFPRIKTSRRFIATFSTHPSGNACNSPFYNITRFDRDMRIHLFPRVDIKSTLTSTFLSLLERRFP